MHPVEALLVPLGRMMASRHADPAAGLAAACALGAPQRIRVESTAFADGAEIPARYCGRFIGDSVSPALSWSDLPAGTTHVVIIVEDLDVPTTIPGLHLIAELPASPGGVPDGGLEPGAHDAQFLPNHRGVSGWVGPRPLPGHGPHHYLVHVLALDERVDLAAVGERGALPAALAGHVLASGSITATRRA